MTNSEIIDGLKALRTIHNGNYAPCVDEAIKRLSAEARWIPVTDEVPKLYEMVLVTRFGDIEKAVRTNLTRSGEICWVINNISYEREDKTTITAWMPLPEPYETESEERHDN